MTPDPIIELCNVSKIFRRTEDGADNIKSVLVDLLTGKQFKRKRIVHTVLDKVNIRITRGERVAFLGRNGAGKSTLMRLLSGIYLPDAGTITIRERVAALVALGAGFHAELSGYENIFLNGAILGIPRSELVGLAPSIVDFSELGSEIHKPVKNYSSGMILRLGFSVAAHVNAPILILDEVMGVGDQGFQRKCFKKLQDLFADGKTLILVTHDPNQVLQYCNRAIVIDGGRVIFDGSPDQGVQTYQTLFG